MKTRNNRHEGNQYTNNTCSQNVDVVVLFCFLTFYYYLLLTLISSVTARLSTKPKSGSNQTA